MVNKKEETTEIMTIPENIGVEMQKIIDECLPATTSGKKNDIALLLKIGWGITALRKLLDNQSVKIMVEALENTPLGFLTDRPPGATDSNGNKLTPYTWDQKRDCVAEALLRGYSIVGNEFNIIAGKFYPAKDGKYRKIIEWPGVTDFKFSNSAPQYLIEKRMVYGKEKSISFASIEVLATWQQDGMECSFGWDRNKPDTQKDKQTFRIRAHGGDDDAVVGKALSKLFTRVLMRLSGQIINNEPGIDDDISLSDDIIDVDMGEVIKNESEDMHVHKKDQEPPGWVKAAQEAEKKKSHEPKRDNNVYLTCPHEINEKQPRKPLAICEQCRDADNCTSLIEYYVNNPDPDPGVEGGGPGH